MDNEQIKKQIWKLTALRKTCTFYGWWDIGEVLAKIQQDLRNMMT